MKYTIREMALGVVAAIALVLLLLVVVTSNRLNGGGAPVAATAPASSTPAPAAVAAAPADFTTDGAIAFGPGGNSKTYVQSGWSIPEPFGVGGGTWSLGNSSVLKFPAPSSATPETITLTLASVSAALRPKVNFTLKLNDKTVCEKSITAADALKQGAGSFDVKCDISGTLKPTDNQLILEVPDPVSPGKETRKLGLFVQRIVLK